MNITDLNLHVLILIFEKCSLQDLHNLHNTNQKFRCIVEDHFFYKYSLNLPYTGHRNRSYAFGRTLHDISYGKRIKLYENWRNGRYEEHIFYNHDIMYSSQILLEKDFFYMTRRGQLCAYKRLSTNFLQRKPHTTICRQTDSDITSFQKQDDTIFAGRENGWSFIDDSTGFAEIKTVPAGAKEEFITCVDFKRNLFVTTSMFSTNFWQKSYELDMIDFEHVCNIGSGFKCIKISPDGHQMVGGKYIDTSKCGLRLIDLKTNIENILCSSTSAVYDVCWKDENTILTANYDTTFRLFDCRTNQDEEIWMDQYDSSVYCLDYDGLNGVLCGMKYNTRVNLFDLRVTKKCIQMYFATVRRHSSSPVYGVSADASQMFIATDHNIRVLNFNVDWAVCKDYSDIFKMY